MEPQEGDHTRAMEIPEFVPEPVVVLYGTRVVAPRGGDCTCAFCSIYRTHHRIWRAVLSSAVVPGPFLLAVWAATAAPRDDIPATPIVGALLIAGTGMLVLALCTWWAPLRRWRHRHRPRSIAWPPPDR
ncbi:MAG: hypothetical protein ACRDXE_09745 [Acidimicrobiales bacterium]